MSQVEVLQQKLEHWCAATIRALADEPSVTYRGHYLHIKGKPFPIQVAHLHLDPESADYRKLRGVADGIAVRLSYSDYELHKKLSPENTLQRWIFELLEQLRVESLVSQRLPGVKANLRIRFVHWSDQVSGSGLTESHAGMLVYALAVTCWSRLTGERIPEQTEDLIEATRMGFGRAIGPDMLKIKHTREDQQAYSEYALRIAKTIEEMIISTIVLESGDDEDEDEALENFIKTSSTSLRLLQGDLTALDHAGNSVLANDIAAMDTDVDYQVFTTAYDKVVEVSKLVRPEKLKDLRDTLDKRIREQSVNIPRLSRYVSKLFSRPDLSGWNFGQEEGFLDSARLTRLLTTPDERKLFKQEASNPLVDCVVSLLIDNSGSMANHSSDIAILVDTLVRAMEMAGVKTEILGFTTSEWNGGKPNKEWISAGRPKNPGRLNQLRHIIYKEANRPWRRSRQAVAGLLKPDLFKEGVDGEALMWANGRLQKRTEGRRIIMVISDGSPMDTATHLANEERYLDKHLKLVASRIESRPDIALCALGVGLDLSAYYQQSLMIIDRELDTKAFFEIVELLNSDR